MFEGVGLGVRYVQVRQIILTATEQIVVESSFGNIHIYRLLPTQDVPRISTRVVVNYNQLVLVLGLWFGLSISNKYKCELEYVFNVLCINLINTYLLLGR